MGYIRRPSIAGHPKGGIGMRVKARVKAAADGGMPE
jgi:hypothetical protein